MAAPRVFRVNAINSDGTSAEDKLIPYAITDDAGKPHLGEDGEPCIVVMLRPISPEKQREVERTHTKARVNKVSRAMEQVVDWEAVQDELIVYTIQSWKGIVGADNKPLDYTSIDVKLALPGDLKNEFIKRAMQGEAVSSTAASF